MEQTVEKVKAELEVIAKKLSLPLENPKVILEWCKNNSYTEEVATKLIAPLYSLQIKDTMLFKWMMKLGKQLPDKRQKILRGNIYKSKNMPSPLFIL